MLLELIFFEMGPPREGNCLEDQLIVTVQNTHRKYPILCGINSGQHCELVTILREILREINVGFSFSVPSGGSRVFTFFIFDGGFKLG